ncbi:universal stress protein [Betaproteobacteria bacterium PRO7]|jgi:nucleotide-binding universal stress UspA family protein|nr:universal stress protein [Betaproteobacteria bacterium PRO7]GIL05754.1 MAG: universal stress protein [Betaproteobacteria bacterium]
MRILLAIDGSGHSHKAVDYLLAHPELLGGRTEITCVFVETPPPLRMVGALGADPGMPSVPPIDPAAIVAPLLEKLRAAGLAVELVVREGDPGLEIAQLACDRGCELIVMGSHGRGLFRRAVLGSVANKVLASCNVAVLIVR